MIRVLLADDQGLIRAGFRVLLEAAGDIEVTGEAVNGEQAVELARPGANGPAANGPAANGPAANRLARLTEREREVLALVAQGLSNDEIATRLFLSPLTTKPTSVTS